MFGNRDKRAQVQKNKMLDSKAVFRNKLYLGYKISQNLPRLDFSNSFLGDTSTLQFFKYIQKSLNRFPDLKYHQVFSSINLSRCGLTVDFLKQIAGDKQLLNFFTNKVEYLDLSGNKIKLNSDMNFILTKLILQSSNYLKYFDLSSINLEDASESEGSTFVNNLQTIICSSQKLEVLRLENISWQHTYPLSLNSSSLKEIRLAYNCLDIYSLVGWIVKRTKFKQLRKMDLSYQQDPPSVQELSMEYIGQHFQSIEECFIQDWPKLRKLEFRENSDFFEQLESCCNDKMKTAVFYSIMRTEIIDFSENKVSQLISFFEKIVEKFEENLEKFPNFSLEVHLRKLKFRDLDYGYNDSEILEMNEELSQLCSKLKIEKLEIVFDE